MNKQCISPFRILVVGYAGVGKSSLLDKLKTHMYNLLDRPILGYSTNILLPSDRDGFLKYEALLESGSSGVSMSNPIEGTLNTFDLIIIMNNAQFQSSDFKTALWLKMIREVNPDIRIIRCRNYSDMLNKYDLKDLNNKYFWDDDVYHISCKTDYGLDHVYNVLFRYM